MLLINKIAYIDILDYLYCFSLSLKKFIMENVKIAQIDHDSLCKLRQSINF